MTQQKLKSSRLICTLDSLLIIAENRGRMRLCSKWPSCDNPLYGHCRNFNMWSVPKYRPQALVVQTNIPAFARCCWSLQLCLSSLSCAPLLWCDPANWQLFYFYAFCVSGISQDVFLNESVCCVMGQFYANDSRAYKHFNDDNSVRMYAFVFTWILTL